jgi:hypothetical protein
MDSKAESQLKLLSVFHYVVAAVLGLSSCFYAALFAVLYLAATTGSEIKINLNGVEGHWLAWLICGLAVAYILSGFAVAGFMVAVARKLANKRGWLFCCIIAGLECLFVPFGTVLGVATLVVLNKDGVREAFEGGPKRKAK